MGELGRKNMQKIFDCLPTRPFRLPFSPGAGLGALFGALFLVQTSLPHLAYSAVVAGKAVSISGKVLIRPDTETDANSRRLQPGDAVHVGDVISTPSDGKA